MEAFLSVFHFILLSVAALWFWLITPRFTLSEAIETVTFSIPRYFAASYLSCEIPPPVGLVVVLS